MSIITQQYDSQKYLLYAVNICLQTIGELPLDNDTDLAHSIEGQLALNVIEETKKNVLAEGWDFSSDTDYQLVPDTQGFIAVPQNMLDLNSSRDADIIIRNWRLYSKKRQSHVFDSVVLVDIHWDLDFNELTHPIRNYVTVRAARVFQSRTIVDPTQFNFNMQDEEDARLSARRSESRTGQYSMLSSSPSAVRFS